AADCDRTRRRLRAFAKRRPGADRRTAYVDVGDAGVRAGDVHGLRRYPATRPALVPLAAALVGHRGSRPRGARRLTGPQVKLMTTLPTARRSAISRSASAPRSKAWTEPTTGCTPPVASSSA